MRYYVIQPATSAIPAYVEFECPDRWLATDCTNIVDPVVLSRDEALADPEYRNAVLAWDRGDDSAYWLWDATMDAEAIALEEHERQHGLAT